jgi:hypothetical protein
VGSRLKTSSLTTSMEMIKFGFKTSSGFSCESDDIIIIVVDSSYFGIDEGQCKFTGSEWGIQASEQVEFN